jgi:hypothetical protein
VDLILIVRSLCHPVACFSPSAVLDELFDESAILILTGWPDRMTENVQVSKPPGCLQRMGLKTVPDRYGDSHSNRQGYKKPESITAYAVDASASGQ